MALDLYARIPAHAREHLPPALAHSKFVGTWPHLGFHRFRVRLAQAEGFDLDRMEGFQDEGESRLAPPRSWMSVQTPLKPLLNHSDANGSLSRADCAAMYQRLREVAAQWPEDDYDRVQAERLAVGMEAVAEFGGRIDFR